jgi:hypothetical protein
MIIQISKLLVMFKKLLCLLGIHSWYHNPDKAKGYGRQDIHVRGCTRLSCNATQLKEGNGNWQYKTPEKFREFLEGI